MNDLLSCGIENQMPGYQTTLKGYTHDWRRGLNQDEAIGKVVGYDEAVDYGRYGPQLPQNATEDFIRGYEYGKFLGQRAREHGMWNDTLTAKRETLPVSEESYFKMVAGPGSRMRSGGGMLPDTSFVPIRRAPPARSVSRKRRRS